jgi:hypothetical protein
MGFVYSTTRKSLYLSLNAGQGSPLSREEWPSRQGKVDDSRWKLQVDRVRCPSLRETYAFLYPPQDRNDEGKALPSMSKRVKDKVDHI